MSVQPQRYGGGAIDLLSWEMIPQLVRCEVSERADGRAESKYVVPNTWNWTEFTSNLRAGTPFSSSGTQEHRADFPSSFVLFKTSADHTPTLQRLLYFSSWVNVILIRKYAQKSYLKLTCTTNHHKPGLILVFLNTSLVDSPHNFHIHSCCLLCI